MQIPSLINVIVLILTSIIAITNYGYGQTHTDPSKSKKGNISIDYGWNVSAYTNSDIRFQGVDYDFVLQDVVAKDRPSTYRTNLYFNPQTFTIPQYNFRIGYFVTDHISVSIGVDHMKYVVTNDQSVNITGSTHFLNSPVINEYKDEQIIITEDFVQFEHTDGLNYIGSDVRYSLQLAEIGFLSIHGDLGLGTGILVPKTNAQILGRERHDDFHLSGYGLNSLAALDIRFYQKVYIKTELKGGFIHMPDIRTTANTTDKASQSFGFAEWTFMFGVQF